MEKQQTKFFVIPKKMNNQHKTFITPENMEDSIISFKYSNKDDKEVRFDNGKQFGYEFGFNE